MATWKRNELLENAVIQLRGIIRTTICYSQTRLNSFHLAWWSTQETSHPDVRKARRTPSESLHGKRPHQEFVPFGAKVLAGRWLGLRNNRAQSFIGALKGVSRAHTKPDNDVTGMPWRLTKEMDSGESEWTQCCLDHGNLTVWISK